MSWKSKIQAQVKQASRQHAIGAGLKELVKELLEYDSEFHLVYSSSREQYMGLRFKDKVSKDVKRMILNDYGLRVWKIIKPRK